MRYNIVCVGNIKEKYYTQAVEEYVKRLSRFADVSILKVEEEKLRHDRPSDIIQVIEKEGERLLAKCNGYVVLCDIGGKMLDSVALSKTLQSIKQQDSIITFVIGGSYGTSEKVRNRADFRLSFSPMTFPHQLMRVVLCEQLYRAETIAKNIAYHK